MLRRRLTPACSAYCGRGDRRRENQDRIFAQWGTVCERSAGLFLVADGCGGIAHGEKISQLIADSFARIWETELPRLLEEAERSQECIVQAITDWTEKINVSAYAFGCGVGERVGSTMTLLMLLDERYYICNAGDSRVYRLGEAGWEQLTEDQSLVADMLRNGELTEAEAERFGHKNVLTMCVGSFEQVRLFFAQGRLKTGDIFLLCSDGLYNALGKSGLDNWRPAHVLPESARELRDRIPAGAAADNVSAIVVEFRG